MVEMKIIVWSDDDNIEHIANQLHDKGYKTNGIQKVDYGCNETKNLWNWCKLNLEDSICVNLLGNEKSIIATEKVEEMPMFTYEVTFIVHTDDDEKAKEDDSANYEIMVGLNDKDTQKQEIPTEKAMEELARAFFPNCTMQECIGFYKGMKETSLKITVYGESKGSLTKACMKVCHMLNQECVILTNIKTQESTWINEREVA